MHASLLSPRWLAPLLLINLVPLARFVRGGPVGTDFLDVENSVAGPDNSLFTTDQWSDDSSPEADMFSSSTISSSLPDDDNDVLLAENPSCHADANLDQFPPYGKLRIRQACPVEKPITPPLALPSLDKLPGPGDGGDGGALSREDLEKTFGLPGTTAEEERVNQLCPAAETYTSTTPVCDSGATSDAQRIEGFASSTLYNIQYCSFDHASTHRANIRWLMVCIQISLPPAVIPGTYGAA